MEGAALLLIFLPCFVSCAGEGNIWLLEEEVATALKYCFTPREEHNTNNQRQRRSENYSRLDSPRQINQYGHEIRNTSDLREQNISVLNATDYDYGGYGTGSGGEKLVTSAPRIASKNLSNETINGNTGNTISNRTKRSDTLLNKADSDQCLSQCVFANLQIVDSQGIPREIELWNKVQSSVTSQQSRTALRDQIRACFQELETEEEDNGCSYSNKLDRCLMLRFSDRTPNENTKKAEN
ncbi:odorant-binding protein 59a-like [Achroia grisella]|uniref:odorant-binding protein 59a-like n=1 Tax=Achroia grisella TaxID=688607 RepID=UPI0027D27E01|nr:odorant-binding protein 59a-like [Achroia grisella]